jgi:enoyl-CoA hydratase
MLHRVIRKQFCQPTYQYIKSSINKGVGIIHLNRPESLNALKDDLFNELNHCLSSHDSNPTIGCVILSGEGQKAFAAGADIKEMKDHNYSSALSTNMLSHWEHISSIRTPIIAAVNGYALGGGCELALMCDIILASDKARFGLPEVTLGTIPGCGGTQRLIR